MQGHITDATLTLGPRKVSSSFYVVRGLKYGILGTDVLASIEIQIDVARKRLYRDGQKVTGIPLSLQFALSSLDVQQK